MKHKLYVSLAAATALVVRMLTLPSVSGQAPDIVINHADAITTLSIGPAAPLSTLIENIGPRFVLENANAIRFSPIAPPDETLISLLRLTEHRIVFQYADKNRFYGLTYPKSLFNDQLPPQITDLTGTVTSTLTTTNLVTFTWLSNEVVTTTFEFGYASGVYTTTIGDDLLLRLHTVGVFGAPNESTIFYRIHHIDRSGNLFSSGEYRFSVPKVTRLDQRVFVPLARR